MISVRGMALIKQWESCRLEAYDDGTGTWTIGWGHTAGVKPGDTCTQAQADAWLLEEVTRFNNHVNGYDDTYHWTQNEEDALTSFAYNIGNIDQLTANGTRTKAEIADKMLLYVNAGGKYMEGLARRRKQERALFLDTGEGGAMKGALASIMCSRTSGPRTTTLTRRSPGRSGSPSPRPTVFRIIPGRAGRTAHWSSWQELGG